MRAEVIKTRVNRNDAPCKQCKTHFPYWIEQGLTSPPTQYRLSGRQFYRSKDPTNSIKVLKEKISRINSNSMHCRPIVSVYDCI